MNSNYSLIKTILSIDKIDVLRKLYQTKFNLDSELILKQIKKFTITTELKDYIKETYNEVIYKNPEYLLTYSNIDLPNEYVIYDETINNKLKRRYTVKELLNKEETVGLTENERMMLYSIRLRDLSTRIHNMGKHGKCDDAEARNVIGGIKTIFKKSKPILDKYGRSREKKAENGN